MCVKLVNVFDTKIPKECFALPGLLFTFGRQGQFKRCIRLAFDSVFET